MSVPPFVVSLLGLRRSVPNTADSNNQSSIAIASKILDLIGSTGQVAPAQDEGAALEEGVTSYLAEKLPGLSPARDWTISRRTVIADFEQYKHLATLEQKIAEDETGTLSMEVGRDYLVRPDVTVGIKGAWDKPFLHAAISCKWTIRSDRVQNIRHEGVIMTRHRRGRQPHIVTVTAEPLPSRIASIARGTGEVDGVYHVALEELIQATKEVGSAEQQRLLREMLSQHRLFNLPDLLAVLAV